MSLPEVNKLKWMYAHISNCEVIASPVMSVMHNCSNAVNIIMSSVFPVNV